MSLPARPADAVALFEALALWGEVSAHEVRVLGVEPWVSVFAAAGALTEIRGRDDEPVAWHLAPAFIHLLESDPQQVGRRLCFAVPEYRAYLVGIVAEGLVDAAHAGMTGQIEQWTREELAPLLPELNALFDALEHGKRLADLPQAELEVRMASLPERALLFAEWDRFALGQSTRPKALFEFALRRFGSSSAPLPTVEETPTVLRTLPLNREDGFNPDEASRPHPWNTQRFGVISGVGIVDAQGRPIFAGDVPLTQQLRDALLVHPFYAAVVHLAISAWRSPASTMPSVELYVPAGALHEVSVLVGSRGAGRVADLLGGLVRSQGFAPFGLVEGRVPDALMGNLLRNLLELRILRLQDELLVLDEEYQSSLMAARLRSVFRPGKALQTRMIEELAMRTATGGAA